MVSFQKMSWIKQEPDEFDGSERDINSAVDFKGNFAVDFSNSDQYSDSIASQSPQVLLNEGV